MVLAAIGGENEDSVVLLIEAHWLETSLCLTVLEKDAGTFCSNLSADNEAVEDWAEKLSTTPDEYLNDLYKAVETCSLQSKCEHLFEVKDNKLNWKKYFKDKKVHGKRGQFPLTKALYERTSWSLLERAAHYQRDSQEKQKALETKNNQLAFEAKKAKELEEKSIKLKEEFQNKSYSKFCSLLNAKKEQIVKLQQKLDQIANGSIADTVSTLSKRKQTISTNASSSDENSDVYDENTDEETEMQSGNALKRQNSDEGAGSSKRMMSQKQQNSSTDLFNFSQDEETTIQMSSIKPRQIQMKKK